MKKHVMIALLTIFTALPVTASADRERSTSSFSEMRSSRNLSQARNVRRNTNRSANSRSKRYPNTVPGDANELRLLGSSSLPGDLYDKPVAGEEDSQMRPSSLSPTYPPTPLEKQLTNIEMPMLSASPNNQFGHTTRALGTNTTIGTPKNQIDQKTTRSIYRNPW